MELSTPLGATYWTRRLRKIEYRRVARARCCLISSCSYQFEEQSMNRRHFIMSSVGCGHRPASLCALLRVPTTSVGEWGGGRCRRAGRRPPMWVAWTGQPKREGRAGGIIDDSHNRTLHGNLVKR